jgi:hypothetical protein
VLKAFLAFLNHFRHASISGWLRQMVVSLQWSLEAAVRVREGRNVQQNALSDVSVSGENAARDHCTLHISATAILITLSLD